uniref:Galactosylgalactosylxylosylprotein 3-beta-glucuronosyltransferase n=2 Tax=Hirondellea gigas TaxID=1518452 RepID=A0A6A7G4T9_9CRUS
MNSPYKLLLLLLLLSLTFVMFFYGVFSIKPSTSTNLVTVNLERIQLEEISRHNTEDNRLNSASKHPPPVWNPEYHFPIIYAVTPTYGRPTQIPELIRLSQTLMQVPQLHWIICEDSNTTSPQLQAFLHHLQLPYTFLLTPMPAKYRTNTKLVNKPKGVAARNAGIQWVRDFAKQGVLYFMDDDNTYDLRLFEEMRWTKRVSMWPVGLVTGLALSSPILRHGRFLGWYDGYLAGRKFAVDMAGFATNIEFLIKVGDVSMPYRAGGEEEGYLKSLHISYSDIEFKANDCTKIYVWHTRTSSPSKGSRMVMHSLYDTTNIRKLQADIVIEPPNEKNNNLSIYDRSVKETLQIK